MEATIEGHAVDDSSSSLVTQTHSLQMPSTTARVACLILIISTTVWAAYTSFLAVLILPVFLAPTIYFFYYNTRVPQAQQIDPNRLYWSYLGTAFPGMLLSTLAQGAILIPFVSLVFGSQKDVFWHEFENVHKESDIRDDTHQAARAAFTATPTYWFFTIFMCFVVTGGTEELLKYAVVTLAKRKQDYVRNMDLIMYGAASGLSFATLEGIGFVIADFQPESVGKPLLTLVERLVMGIPIHVICGTLTAVNIARRQLKQEKLSFLRIIGPAILFHGLLNFVLLGYCASAGIVGWIHPDDIGTLISLMLAVMAVIVAAAFVLRSELTKLNSSVVL